MTWLLVETQMHTAQASKHPWTHTHTCFLWEVSKTLIHVREAHWDNVYSIGLWYIKNISLFHFHSYWAMITFALSCLITTSKCMSVCQKLRCWPADSAFRLGQSLLRVTGEEQPRPLLSLLMLPPRTAWAAILDQAYYGHMTIDGCRGKEIFIESCMSLSVPWTVLRRIWGPVLSCFSLNFSKSVWRKKRRSVRQKYECMKT